MYCLFVDSSFDQCICALWHNRSVLAEIKVMAKEAQHCTLWQTMLDAHGLTLSHVQAMACGVGPGSYTGIRSAIASAQAVAVARSIPLIPLCSLLVFVPEESGSYVIAVDGGISGLYAQRMCLSDDAHLSVKVEEPFCTTASLLHDPQIFTSERVPPGLCAIPRESSSQVAALYAMQQIASGNYGYEVKPLYLRKTQAELARGE